jgi:tetratricopeptide (TPR) repeat protein
MRTRLQILCVVSLALQAAPAWGHPEIERQIADLGARIEKEPANPELFIRRGELHRLHRDWAAAQADYDTARRVDPGFAAVDFFVGRMKAEAGEIEDGKRLLDRFLETHPRHVQGLLTRAEIEERLGQHLAAGRDYTAAIENIPAGERPLPSHYLGRARALAAAGPQYLEQALRGIEEGLVRLDRPITLEIEALELELALGRHDAALARVDRIAADSARKETWLVRRGEILEQAGRPAEARKAYADALVAIESLPSTRRWNRAVARLETQAKEAQQRLHALESKD